jgi:hypothetical protein
VLTTEDEHGNKVKRGVDREHESLWDDGSGKVQAEGVD